MSIATHLVILLVLVVNLVNRIREKSIVVEEREFKFDKDNHLF